MLYDTIVKTGLTEKYHNLGTSENILVLNELKGLPTRNLQETSIEGVENNLRRKLCRKISDPQGIMRRLPYRLHTYCHAQTAFLKSP